MENIQYSTVNIGSYLYLAYAFLLLIYIIIYRKSIKEFLCNFLNFIDELPIILMYSAIVALPIFIIFAILEIIF